MIFMGLIKGITVILYEKVKTGEDRLHHPIYEEYPTYVDNVLAYPASTSETLDTQNLTGAKAVYNIAIPKGDTHTWRDCKVEFFGETWKVTGLPQRGIEDNIPLDWNDKWTVERYE